MFRFYFKTSILSINQHKMKLRTNSNKKYFINALFAIQKQIKLNFIKLYKSYLAIH